MYSTRLRFAAGVCVLTSGLMVGSASGAIAAADSDGTGSATHSSQGGGGAKQPGAGPSTGGAPSLRDTLRDAVRQITGTLTNHNSGTSGTGTDSATDGKHVDAAGSSTSDEDADAGAGKDLDDAVSAVTDASTVAVAGATEPTTPADPAAATSTPTATEPTSTDPVSTVPSATDPHPGGAAESASAATTAKPAGASHNNTAATPANPLAPVTKVVDTVGNSVTTVGTAMASAAALLAAIPASDNPTADVIKSVQIMLTSMVDAITPLAQLPSDLAGLLGVPVVDNPQTLSVPATHPLPPVATLLVPQTGPRAPAPVTPSAPLRVEPAVPAAPTPTDYVMTALSEPLAGTPAPVPNPPVEPSLFQKGVTSLLVPVSLWALLTAALPGLGGLIIISAAGVRVGYRQAKAGLMMRTSAIARFAPGPLGVVRSGTFISVRPRRAQPPTTAESANVVRFLHRAA